MPTEALAGAKVVAVQDDIVTIEALPGGRALMQNEVVYVLPRPSHGSYQERLKAEVLRINGHTADAQVFESTAGVAVGDAVEQSGTMLSVELGPGTSWPGAT